MASSMEVDGAATVLAASGTPGSVTVSLHPLVVMNVSEHWTRVRAQEGRPTQVYGAVIGQQRGRHVEVMNSFELVTSEVEGQVVVDRDYYQAKEAQFKQVFADLDFLGWYTSGEGVSAADVHLHRQMCEIEESPLLVKLDPAGARASGGGELPVAVYESVIDVVAGAATMLLVRLPYTLATEEAERIGVDHVARVAGGGSGAGAGGASSVAEQLAAWQGAIRMLHGRVRLVLEHVRDMQAGRAPHSPELLRLAGALCSKLPVLSTPAFTGEFYNQANDVQLIAYLGAVTKGCNTLNQYVNKFNVLYDKQGLGRRMRGLFF